MACRCFNESAHTPDEDVSYTNTNLKKNLKQELENIETYRNKLEGKMGFEKLKCFKLITSSESKKIIEKINSQSMTSEDTKSVNDMLINFKNDLNKDLQKFAATPYFQETEIGIELVEMGADPFSRSEFSTSAFLNSFVCNNIQMAKSFIRSKLQYCIPNEDISIHLLKNDMEFCEYLVSELNKKNKTLVEFLDMETDSEELIVLLVSIEECMEHLNEDCELE